MICPVTMAPAQASQRDICS